MRGLSATMRGLALAAATVLAGCAGAGSGPFGERITGADHFPTYNPSQFSAFAAAGPVVELRGAPPGGASPEAVAAALRLPGFWPQTPFRGVGPGGAPRAQRIVLVFGGSGPLCEGGPDTSAVETPGRLVVRAAFCRGSTLASTALLTVDRPLTLEDPDFSRAMTRLFNVLAPRTDPLERNRGEGPMRLIIP